MNCLWYSSLIYTSIYCSWSIVFHPCSPTLFSILVLSSLFSPCCSISLVLHPCSLSIVLSLLSFPLSYLPCSFSLVLSLIYIRLGCNGLFPQLLTLHSRSVVFTLNDTASYIAFQSDLLATRNLAIQVILSQVMGPALNSY